LWTLKVLPDEYPRDPDAPPPPSSGWHDRY
jgi:hypothetical protein